MEDKQKTSCWLKLNDVPGLFLSDKQCADMFKPQPRSLNIYVVLTRSDGSKLHLHCSTASYYGGQLFP